MVRENYLWVAMPARILMSLLFLLSGYNKLVGASGTQHYMESYGVPGILVWPAAAWELAAGTCLILGLFPRLVSLGLVGWCFLTAFIFHTGWSDSTQQMHFFKNVTMAGAFLVFAAVGMPGWSIMTRRRLP